MNKDEQPPSKEALIKAQDALDTLSDWALHGHIYNSVLNECQEAIEKVIDAQLSALEAKPMIKACDVPKIEGLGEAIHDLELLFEDIPLTPYGYELYEPVLQAARAYHKITGGE
jgi:hypothetical protein